MHVTDRFDALRAMKAFERDKIQKLIPELERVHKEVIEYSKGCGPTTVQLETKEGRRCWISPEGINIVIWSSDAIVGGCLYPMHRLHREYGLTSSQFVEKYVTNLDKAREIANAIKVDL
jgi:hypothetical protein